MNPKLPDNSFGNEASTRGAMELPRPGTKLDAAELQAAMDRNVLELLPLVTGGLAWLFAGLAVLHLLLLQADPRWMMATTAVLSAVTFWKLGARSRSKRIPLAQAQGTAVVVLLISLVNIVLHVVVTEDPILSTDFMLLIIGTGCLLLSWPWFISMTVLSWLSWWEATRDLSDAHSWHFIFGLGMGTAIGGLIHAGRRQRVERYESLLAEQRQTCRELEAARKLAEQSSRATTGFLVNMSHEIRTPMNAIVGMAELLLGTSQEPRQVEYARNLKRSAESLLALLTDVLDLADIEAGKLQLNGVVFDPSQLTAEAVERYRPAAAAKHLSIEFSALENVPAQINGDADRVAQVLRHLLDNAVKFTDRGGVKVRLAGVSEPTAGQRLRWEIEDTGVGIAPEIRPHLFDAFTQGDGSATRRHGGVGLGLAISHRLIDLMGGSIRFDSQLAKGSQFSIEVPAAPAESGKARESADDAMSLSVLVAEDNVVNQLFARRLLESLGHTVEVASNGLEAVTQASQGRFHVILMDCQMPVVDGYEASRRLRSQLGDACPGIIAVTANALAGERERCLAAGMGDFLTKPVRKAELAAALRRATRS